MPRALAASLLCAALAGCGKQGPPMAPRPRGPLPPGEVTARQIGSRAVIAFGAPEARGPNPRQALSSAELVRVTYPPGVAPPPDPDAFRRRGEVVGRSEDGAFAPGTRVSIADERLSDLEDGGTGWTLRYAVRVRDGRGRGSLLAVAEDLVPLPSAPAPSQLRAEPTAGGVQLAWTAVEGPDPGTYNVYRGAPGGPLGERPLNATPLSGTSYLDTSVEIGRSYVYAVRTALAAQTPYREGDSSDAVEVVAEDRFAPAAPRGLVAVQEGPSVRLFWDPSPERDVVGYRVHRSLAGGEWRSLQADPVAQTTFVDRDVQEGDRPGYRVTALDGALPPNESEPSAPVAIEIVAEPLREP